MPFVASGPWTVLSATAWFALFVAAFHGVGCLIARDAISRQTAGDMALYHAVTISAGMVVCAAWIFACGLAEFLLPGPILAFVAAGAAACWRDKRFHGAREWRTVAGFFRAQPASKRWAFAALTALAVLSFVAAQAPETGNDSMAYHLHFPKLHALAGRLVHDAFHPRSLWPAMPGMLFTAGLALQGVALAKLFAWMALPLALLAVAGFASRAAGRAEPLWATAFLALVPALWQQSLFAYTDNTILLFSFVSFAALMLWEESGYAARSGVVAGLALAGLMSIKYSTLITVVFFGVVFGVPLVRRKATAFRAKASALAIVAGTTALFSGFWYWRSWLITGNPVFPFMAGVFGNGFPQGMVGWALLPKTWTNLALLPWNLAMRVDTFGGEPLGALFLAALPFLVFFPRHDRRARVAGGFVLFYALIWFWSVQHVRFLLPALSFAAFVLGACVARGLSEGKGRAPAVVLAVLGATQFLLAVYYPLRLLKPALGIVPAAQYLRENERSFVFMEKIGPILAGEPALFMDEPRLFYAPPGSIAMSPIIERDCARRGITLDYWLRENGVRYVATAGETGFPEPPFRAECVAESVGREAGRKVYHALWRLA